MGDYCEHCHDGDGHCDYPMYGLAPHDHVGKRMIGSTVIRPKSEWPANFREDPDAPGCGVYTHCLKCGRGEPPAVLQNPEA